MRHFRLATMCLALLMLTLGAGIAFGQEDGEQSYTGTWSLVIGPSRLVWELDADTYQFYAYQAGTVRIGSRGDIIIEDDRITFIARETTEDGEQWTEVDLPEEQAQTSFAYSVNEVRIFSQNDEAMGGDAEMAADEADAVVEQQLVLRLAIPGRPQFFTDYREGSGEELTGETDDAAGDDAGEPNGTNDGEG